MSHVTRFFLGANSRHGFASLYDTFPDDDKDFLYIIKGGPGCGKSSFMRRIGAAAEERGFPVEYIHCSGDPDSLDAVYLPVQHMAYADGTAPHVLDAAYPAVSSLYLDLGHFYDRQSLLPLRETILDLNSRYREHYRRAYACLSAAANVSAKGIPALWGKTEQEKLRRKAEGFASREFCRGDGGRVQKRFLRAISCQGERFFRETAETLCGRICTLDNELGLAGVYLSFLAELAAERGIDAILCPDPLDPEVLDAILLPSLSLGFLAVDREHPYDGPVYRHYRLDRLASHDIVTAARAEIRRTQNLQSELIRSGIDSLGKAKALHDELEAAYNPQVDFKGVYQLAEDHIQALFG